MSVFNDFDFASFANEGTGGKCAQGTMPFLALDLLSKEGLCGEIPRLYRHDARSFAWCLICLCFSTVEDEDGKNCTENPDPLRRLFMDRESSRAAKRSLGLGPDHDAGYSVPRMVYPNTKWLAYGLHAYWTKRYDWERNDEYGRTRWSRTESPLARSEVSGLNPR